MYQQYFGLSEAPFSIAPDPRYLFLSDKHREALAHLIYGVGDQGGFVVLTGEVGTGKTTICRCLLQQIPDNADIAFIINPKQSINQLLQSIFSDLSIAYDAGVTSKDLIDQLNHYLLDAHSRGRNTILIIDEAQNLSTEILEQLRLLTNLETNEKKLLQLVLLGQPELNELLGKPELRQLAQRVTARYHLSPLSKAEVTEYIQHRLSVAGCRSELFSSTAIKTIYQLSKGVPRLINLICDRVLLGVYSSNGEQATSAVVRKASKELFFDNKAIMFSRWKPVFYAAVCSVLIFAITYVVKNDIVLTSADQINSAVATPASREDLSAVGLKENSQWRDHLQRSRAPEASMSRLYSLWSPAANISRISGCRNRPDGNKILYCRESLDNLQQLQVYNRPLVLAVRTNSSASESYLLVRDMTDGRATVIIGESEYSVGIEELKSMAISRSFLLSRIPTDYRFPIHPGYSGKEVLWLQSVIAQYKPESFDTEMVASSESSARPMVDTDVSVGGNKTDILYAHYLEFSDSSFSTNYGVELERAVKRIQKEFGFKEDAVVDVPLLVALNKKINREDPVLDAGYQYARFHKES